MPYVRSYHQFETSYQKSKGSGGRRGTRIRIPASSYHANNMIKKGSRSVVFVSDVDLEYLRTFPIFRYFEMKGDKGGFVVTAVMPDGSKTTLDRLAEEREKNKKLQAELESIKTPDKPKPVYAREDLKKLQFIELKEILTDRGVAEATKSIKRAIALIIETNPPVPVE